MKNKYIDKGTLRNNYKWDIKPKSDFWEAYDRKIKKELKKKIKIFSEKISDKIWWLSISEEDQKNVYQEFESSLKIRRTYVISNNDNNYKEWESGLLVSLMKKYRPILEIKRDLIIDDIIKES